MQELRQAEGDMPPHHPCVSQPGREGVSAADLSISRDGLVPSIGTRMRPH